MHFFSSWYHLRLVLNSSTYSYLCRYSFYKLSNMKTRTFFNQFTQYPLLSGPSRSLALVIVFASGPYNLDRQTLSERNNLEVKMFMRNVRNEIKNHSDGCIFSKIRLKIILMVIVLRKRIENRLDGYIFWDWATSRSANILRNKIENHPNVYIYWEIELKIILMAIFSETRNWKSCRWIYFLWGPKWSELLLWEGGEPW